MKKFFLIIFLLIVSAFCYKITSAQNNKNGSKEKIHYLSYLDYYPISKIDEDSYSGVFDNFIEDFCQSHDYSCVPALLEDYTTTVKNPEKKDLDMIIGVYSDSTLYTDYKIIYPSILDNPVHLIMLPSRIKTITKLNDLKSLKGAIDTHEQWNDFVSDQFKNLNIETVSSSEEMYRKLIDGEIDYVFATYWYGVAEIMRLGIQDFVSVSQKGIWNMPLFVAVADTSRNKTYLRHYMTEYLKRAETISKIKERAIEILNEIKTQNKGVVPEAYILKKDDN